MSSKNTSRRPASKFKLPFVGGSGNKEPRALDVITKEYQEATMRLGQAAYQKFVFAREVEQLEQQILRLNEEAAMRNQLDKKEEAQNEQP